MVRWWWQTHCRRTHFLPALLGKTRKVREGFSASGGVLGWEDLKDNGFPTLRLRTLRSEEEWRASMEKQGQPLELRCVKDELDLLNVLALEV